MLYLLCQRNPTPFPLLFLSSRAVPPRPTDISISTFVALSNFHITTFLLRNYIPERCSTLYFFSLSDFAVANDSLEFLLDQSFIRVVSLLGKRVGKQRVIIKTITVKSSPLHLQYDGTPFAFWELFLWLTTLAFHLIRCLFPATPLVESRIEAKCEIARTWQPSIRTRATRVKWNRNRRHSYTRFLHVFRKTRNRSLDALRFQPAI